MIHEELITFLDSEANEYGLDSIATHGYLTATVICKSFDDWQVELFEGHEIPVEIKEALTNWQTEISNQLKSETSINLPFINSDSDSDSDGNMVSAKTSEIGDDNQSDEDDIDFSPESDISAWSVGFVDAMYAEGVEDWFSDEDTEDDVAMLTLPMVVFSGIDEDDETLEDMRNDEDMLAQMANNIARNLTELYLLFHTND